MFKIDSHQHFWKYEALRDTWISDDMSIIKKDFLPEHLKPLLDANGFQACCAIQSDQSEKETLFLLDLADSYDFIEGVIGWVDLCDANLEDKLKHYSSFNKLKGFRHILQAEPAEFMLKQEFLYGIAALQKYGFTYDVLIYPEQIKNTITLVEQNPEQSFVIDHIAKPQIKSKKIGSWETDMKHLAKNRNVYCKVSGLVTEANWKNWTKQDFVPYLDSIFNSFEPDRLMFGSDWPVCNLAAEYTLVCELMEDYLSTCSSANKQLFWGENAANFYKLSK